MDAPVVADQQELIYINSADAECGLEDLPGAMDDRDG